MTESEFEVVENMEKYGGSFVKALAECFHRADPNNFKKLKKTFINYWVQYSLKNPPMTFTIKSIPELRLENPDIIPGIVEKIVKKEKKRIEAFYKLNGTFPRFAIIDDLDGEKKFKK